MSDQDDAAPLFTPEMLELLKARDQRWNHVDLASRIERELAQSIGMQTLIEAISIESDRALQELAFVSPSNTAKIIDLQARCFMSRFVHSTLQMALTRGDDAVKSLEEDGPVAIEDPIEGE